MIDSEAAAIEITELLRKGVTLVRAVELPPEAESFRAEARAAIDAVKDLDGTERVRALVASGYAVPHWPMPPFMSNDGNYTGSLGNLCRWLAEQATELGVEIFPDMGLVRDQPHPTGGVETGATELVELMHHALQT